MSSDVFRGRYLFHLHTTRTDGRLTPDDYLSFARAARVERLIYLEHIRRQPKYDVGAFVDEVCAAGEASRVATTIGFEAKILPEGDLDIADGDAERAAVIGIAEHGFPDDVALLERAFARVVERWTVRARPALVWVHPGLWFKKRRLDPATQPAFVAMLALARGAGIAIERNLRYDLVRAAGADAMSPAPILGADAHDAADLERWRVAADATFR